MSQIESNDVERLFKESVHIAPDVAINYCVGRNGHFGEKHHPFIVMKRAKSSKFLWEDDYLAEYDTLDEALNFPSAKPYGSSTLCSSCKQLPVKSII